jgi:Galactose oxidase, central domain
VRGAGGWKIEWQGVALGNGVPARTQHTACYHKATHSVFIFGGYSTSQGYLNDLWVLDLGSGEFWKPADTGDVPAGRRGHVGEVVGDALWVFGGAGRHGMLGDIHTLDLKTWQWTTVGLAGPAPCACRAAASCVANGRWVVVQGGFDGGACLRDTHVLDTSARLWMRLDAAEGMMDASPGPRALHSVCAIGHGILMYGGAASSTVLSSAHLLHNAAIAAGAQLQAEHQRTTGQLLETQCSLVQVQAAADVAAARAKRANDAQQVHT